MKNFLYGGILLIPLAFAGSAGAADLVPYKAPSAPAATAFTWTGFYIGADIGGGTTHTNATTVPDPAAIPGGFDLQSFALNGSGFLGGLHAGYNWQVAPNWLLGVEDDIDWTSIKASSLGPLTIGGIPNGGIGGVTTADSLISKLNWLATIRGRVGYTTSNWLFYATGGAAIGGLNQSATQSVSAFGLSANWPFSAPTTREGWVAGGGFEYSMTQNWILRAEYLFYSLRGANRFGFPIGSPSTTLFADNFGRTEIQTVRTGISYKFN